MSKKSIFRESEHLNRGARRQSRLATRFGAVSSDRENDTAPTSRSEAEMFFVVNRGPHIFVQTFNIMDGGVLANFPILLGQPFFWQCALVLSYDQIPPVCSIAGNTYELAPEPISMLDIEFVSRDYAQGRWCPPSPARLHFLDNETKTVLKGICALTNARTSSKDWGFGKMLVTAAARQVKQPVFPHAQILASIGEDDEDMVLDAVDDALAANMGRENSESGIQMQSRVSSSSSGRATGEPPSWGTEAAAEAERAHEHELLLKETDLEKRHRELYRFMRSERRSLGHSKAAEFLYSGDAMRCLQEIRKSCRFCQGYDNNLELRRRGAMQQFAISRNLKWLIDVVFVKIGVLVKIVDVCTRMRILELCDAALGPGGQTGTAIKCHMRAKRILGGAPEMLIFDLGQEFISKRFQKVVAVDNVQLEGIGYKEPWRISKLERGNRQDKQRCYIATEPPFEPYLELFLWNLAMQKVEEELFEWDWEELMDELVSVQPDSNLSPDVFEMKQLIVLELEWQANQVPILGTTIAPQNAHTGSFTRGDRDWEEQMLASEVEVDEPELDQVDALFRRYALTQERCRRVVLEKDIELLQRRRELVSRAYQRGGVIEKYQIGDAVFVRRPVRGKFCRWHAGVITSVNANDRTATINRNGHTQPYGLHDVAHLPPVADHWQYEFYPDGHLLEMIESRGGVVAIEDQDGLEVDRVGESNIRSSSAPAAEGEPDDNNSFPELRARRDVFTSVRNGVSTHRGKSTGSQYSDKHKRTSCGKEFTSLRRFLQHAGNCAGRVASNFRWGKRERVSLDVHPPDQSLGLRREPGQNIVSSRASIRSSDGGFSAEEQAQLPRGSIALGGMGDQVPSADEMRRMTGNMAEIVADLVVSDDEDEQVAATAPAMNARAERHARRQQRLQEAERRERLKRLDKPLVRKTGAKRPKNRALQVFADEDDELAFDREEPSAPVMPAPPVQQEPLRQRSRHLLSSSVEESKSAEDRRPWKVRRTDGVSADSLYTYSSERQAPLRGRQNFKVADGESFLSNGVLHPAALKALNACSGSVQVGVESGKVYFSADDNVPDADAERAVDYSVLPRVKELLEAEAGGKQVYRLCRGSNDVCFLMSQMCNGRCIRGELNVKDNRDIRHVCTEAHCFQHKLTGHLPTGRRVFVRWGDEFAPIFCREESAREEIRGTWVIAIFYEVCENSHEAMAQCTEGNKTGTIVTTLKDAARLGFLGYVYSAMAKEVKTVYRHGVFEDETYRLEELRAQKKNIVPSRMLLAIKIDRITGQVVKVKGRWITQGFRDRRFHGDATENMPARRSHTISDVAASLMANYFQARQTVSTLSDILEAFLRSKRMLDVYDRRADIEVLCHIPDEIQEIQIEGVPVLGEAKKMRGFLYGQKDAPAGWEITLWDYSLGIGFVQSMVDPCLFLYYPNSVELEVLKLPEETQVKYFHDKVHEVRKCEGSDLRGRVAILEQGAASRETTLVPCDLNKSFVNPHSQLINDQLVPHSQREEEPDGIFGVHVDDLWSGGGLMFWLRLTLLFDAVELGSFTYLQPGMRDSYIGRELSVVPAAIDRWKLQEYLGAHAERTAEAGITFPQAAVEAPSEDEVAAAEQQNKITRQMRPRDYPESPKVQFDPLLVPANYQMKQEAVYYIAQEAYAAKLSLLHKEEVEQYFEQRRRAGSNKWARKNVKSPFKGRLGELLWLKSNAVISATVSILASAGHEAEKCESFAEVDGFVEDINGVILLAQWEEMNTQRIYRLGNLRELFLGGAADAGMDRIGVMPFLAALQQPRINAPSNISKKPGRVFSSSTGIEILAQKVCSSELVFILQILLDLALCSIGRPLLQLCDSRNTVCEPRERNLKPDFQGLAAMIRAKLLEMGHIAGVKMFVDGLTKDIRTGLIWLLHLAANWGLLDEVVWETVQAFTRKVLSREKEKTQLHLEDVLFVDDDVEEIPPPLPEAADSRLYFLSANGNGWVLSTAGQDYWWEDDVKATRECVLPRVARFTPVSKAIPPHHAAATLTDDRTTHYSFVDEPNFEQIAHDNW
eukprot:g18374.t1